MKTLAFFWDIENCQVPLSKSTLAVVQKLREKFGANFAEVEFIVVCDVNKERVDVVEELNAAQVTVIHVNALAKNACDDKLRTSMTKFSMVYSAPGVIILISSDVNFTHALTDLRYRCGFQTVLIHNDHVSSTLLVAANEHYHWQDILAAVADRTQTAQKAASSRMHRVVVSDLPVADEQKIRDRLKQLSNNCGGRVLDVNNGSNTAVIGFATWEAASRAQKRVDGADVFGKRISVSASGQTSTNGGGASRLRSPSPSTSSLIYIGRREIAHHFKTRLSPDAVASASEESQEHGGAVEDFGEDDGELVDNEATDENAMQSTRYHFNETEKLKKVLGFPDRRDNSMINAARDDGELDFTPVKISESSSPSHGHAVQNIASPDEKHHGTGPKLRVLERFAREAVELLRSNPHCRIPLQRFASSWCKHFNRPLRLAEFECSRLADLLEGVGDTLRVVTGHPTKEKWVTLTPPLLWSSLQDQIVSVLRQQPCRRLPIENFLESYQSVFGYPLVLRLFGFSSIEEVMSRMEGVVEIEVTDSGTRVATLVEFRHRQMLANQLLYMFIRCPERRLASWQLENEFRAEFGIDVSLEDVKNYLYDLVLVTEYDAESVFIELNQVQRLALRLRRILVANGGELPLADLEQLYIKTYGERIQISDMNNSGATKSVLGVLRMASHVLYLKGRGLTNCTVCINRNFLSSLKDTKPDLFIPAEITKSRKKTSSQSRSSSLSGNITYDKIGKNFNGKSHPPSNDKPGPSRVKPGPMPISETKINAGPKDAPRTCSLAGHDDVSAASTPPDRSGFERREESCLDNKPLYFGVLLAGSGTLPRGLSPGMVPVTVPIRGSNWKDFARPGDPVSNAATTTTKGPPSPLGRRTRLAANFNALSKAEGSTSRN